MIKVKALLIFFFLWHFHGWSAAETECGTPEKCDSFESNVHDRNSLQEDWDYIKTTALVVIRLDT